MKLVQMENENHMGRSPSRVLDQIAHEIKLAEKDRQNQILNLEVTKSFESLQQV